VVNIEDNGLGIKEEEKALLFSPYFRAGKEKYCFNGREKLRKRV
jgi:K+-sensing histidine kinase KdpD